MELQETIPLGNFWVVPIYEKIKEYDSRGFQGKHGRLETISI